MHASTRRYAPAGMSAGAGSPAHAGIPADASLAAGSGFASGARRLLFGSLLLAAFSLITACGGGGGSTAVSSSPQPDGAGVLPDPPNPESGPEAIGVYTGFSGDPAWEKIVSGVQGDGGAGGVGAGADGGGGVGVGGSLGQFRNAIITAMLEDGTRLGEAVTHPETGMVTVRPGRAYSGSLVVELIGQGGTEYFDEARGAWVGFPAGQKLRAHVDVIRGNIGLTPFSEAAVALSETDLQLAVLPLAQKAKEANERIRLAVNSHLPAAYAIDQLTRLPVLVGPSSGKGALTATPAGRFAGVLAALTFAANRYNPILPAPGLNVATQLVRDLADGRLNGGAPDGASLAPADQLAYDAAELPSQLAAGIDQANERYGVDAADPTLPRSVGFGRYAAGGAQVAARLTSDGQVLVTSPASGAESPLPANPGLPATALPATALFSDGAALLIRRVDGSLHGVGTNAVAGNTDGGAFRFGIASPAATTVPVDAAAVLSKPGATAIVFGTAHTVARSQDGQALAWGDNSGLQLGVAGQPAQVSPLVVPTGGGVQSVAASLDFSLARLGDGRVISWGSERQGALGRGPNAIISQPPGPVLAEGGGELSGVVSVVAAGATSLAVRSDGSVWGWGSALQGLLSDEPQSFRYVAAPVRGLSATREIVEVGGGLLALDEAGMVRYWGSSGGEQGGRVLPAPLDGLPPIRDLQESGGDGAVAFGFGDEVFAIGAFGAVAR